MDRFDHSQQYGHEPPNSLMDGSAPRIGLLSEALSKYVLFPYFLLMWVGLFLGSLFCSIDPYVCFCANNMLFGLL